MKATKSLAIAVIAMSVLASNAFADHISLSAQNLSSGYDHRHHR